MNHENPSPACRKQAAKDQPQAARRPDPYPQFQWSVRTLRLFGAGFLFLLFFGTVWLNWGDRQAVLWDLSESKFHIFAATFWPQDFILLSALLIICAFGLFAITVFAGRIWCGYTCPQSILQRIAFRLLDLDQPDIYSTATSRFVAPLNR